jgi:CheY-like chemotaxis protein
MSEALRSSYHVTETGSVSVAVALAAKGAAFDLVILDLQVPDDGVAGYFALLEVAPELARRVVVLTRAAPIPRQQDFLGVFPGRVLVRPFSAHHLHAVLEEVCARAGRARPPRASRRTAA